VKPDQDNGSRGADVELARPVSLADDERPVMDGDGRWTEGHKEDSSAEFSAMAGSDRWD